MLAGRRFEAHREAGDQGIDMVQPVVEVELPEDGGGADGKLLAETGERATSCLARPKVQNGVCVGQQTLTGGSPGGCCCDDGQTG